MVSRSAGAGRRRVWTGTVSFFLAVSVCFTDAACTPPSLSPPPGLPTSSLDTIAFRLEVASAAAPLAPTTLTLIPDALPLVVVGMLVETAAVAVLTPALGLLV
eukprot:Platyproteum_vivax@DN16059_c0_g1_i1.p3